MAFDLQNFFSVPENMNRYDTFVRNVSIYIL